MKNDGGYVFPRKLPDIEVPPDECLDIIERYSGMTLRDCYAGKALQGIVSQMSILDANGQLGTYATQENINKLMVHVAVASFAYADAMITVRNEE